MAEEIDELYGDLLPHYPPSSSLAANTTTAAAGTTTTTTKTAPAGGSSGGGQMMMMGSLALKVELEELQALRTEVEHLRQEVSIK